MHFYVEGYERVTKTGQRNLLNLKIDELEECDDEYYPFIGAKIRASQCGVYIRYRMNVTPNMGGNYKAELFLSAEDIAFLFVRVFRHYTVDKLMHFLNGGTMRGLKLSSLWKGPAKGSDETTHE